jgi:hypothetical protein
VGAADRLRSCFRQAEVVHLTFPNQVLHRSRRVFDRHLRVHAVLIEQVNSLDAKSLE